ncbi:MAG: hypothetical protein U5K77_01470 [Candidatus Saccharibacteria bacterium]|nr:hypothetical protein [Candidatus Saccharibacteria bacterium]
MQNEQDQYDFILNDKKGSKKSLLPAMDPKKKRLLLIFGGGVLFITLIVIIFGLISSLNNKDREFLINMVQQHAEIVRVAEIGEDKARNQATRNLAVTTKLALQSSQDDIVNIANKTGKVSSADIAGGMSVQTDEELETAEQNNSFDEAFEEILYELLEEYRATLVEAYDISTSEANKQVYSDTFNQIRALLPPED